MRHRSIVWAAVFVALFGLGVGARSYALYYDCSGTQDTALVIMNSGGEATHYLLKLYDAYGTRLDPKAESGDLEPYESDYVVLSKVIERGEARFGLALIETPGLLTVGVETFEQETWLGSDNVVDAVPDEKTYATYWYGLNYSNTSEQTTGIVLVNPGAASVAGTLFLYDSYGSLAKKLDFMLEPHETDYYPSATLAAAAASLLGILDVKATSPLVLAAEYFDAAGALRNVDQSTHFYYAE